MVSAVNTGIGVVNVAQSLGSFGKVSDRDQARINAAQDALKKALAGDSSALAYMQQQSQNSATAVGKSAFVRALQVYADTIAGKANPNSYTPPPTAAPSALQQVVTNTTNAVRDDVANGVQQIGAGATNAATSAIAGTSAGKSSFLLPTDPKTLLIVGAALLGLIVILKKHK